MNEKKMIEFKDNEELGKYVEEHKIIKESIKCSRRIWGEFKCRWYEAHKIA